MTNYPFTKEGKCTSLRPSVAPSAAVMKSDSSACTNTLFGIGRQQNNSLEPMSRPAQDVVKVEAITKGLL